MAKETKLDCALHCFCSFFVQAKRRKIREENKSRYGTVLLVRKNPNSFHVWDLFFGFNWALMFVLILFWL